MTTTYEHNRSGGGAAFRIGGLALRSRVVPAPMCNITDRAFRAIARSMGADLVVTQMVSAEGLTRNDRGTWDLFDIQGEQPPVMVQLLGSNPDSLARAAQIAEAHGAAAVDLNMGCPARKITGNDCGSALMRTPELVRRIVRAMRAALKIPFTVKMRAGWDSKEFLAVELAKMCEAEGVDAVALHARTRQQGYSGQADWSFIARLKDALSIPVIGNGDVCSPADAVRMLRQTGCEAVMIGRGLIGNPWLLRACCQAAQALDEGRIRDESQVDGEELVYVEGGDGLIPVRQPYYMKSVTLDERFALVVSHTRAMAEAKGERRAVLEMRKHTQQYIKGIRGCKILRERLMHVETLEGVEALLAEYRASLACFETKRGSE